MMSGRAVVWRGQGCASAELSLLELECQEGSHSQKNWWWLLICQLRGLGWAQQAMTEANLLVPKFFFHNIKGVSFGDKVYFMFLF